MQRLGAITLVQGVEALLEATGMGLLSLGQGLEPIGDLAEAFLARCAGHAWVHIGVLIGLTCDGRRQV